MNLETAKDLIDMASISAEGYVAVLNEDTECPFFMKEEASILIPQCDLASSITPKRMFATEEECRLAVEEDIERLNAAIDGHNVLMRANGMPEVQPKKIEDYLVKIMKIRYVRKLEVI